MAVLDPRDDSVVIRVVYDGAPLVGKTTSVCALGKGLGASVYTPADVEGRTLFFDWLDYTGGLFEGHRIRCQIISVPGQATLAPRRRRLLETADVVVFVGDSTPQGVQADANYLAALNNVLLGLSGPPVGIVLQANKRDLPEAVDLDTLRDNLDRIGLRLAIVESVATEGSGIREAFVFAVRLALDRVRELMRTNELKSSAPEVDSGQELLRGMQEAEDGALDMAAASGLKHTRLNDLHSTHSRTAVAEARDSAPVSMATAALREAVQAEVAPSQPASRTHESPAPPDERVASGLIWPPVDGRVILHETSIARPDIKRLDDGSWQGSTPRHWKFHSVDENIFTSLEDGRSALVNWARIHSAINGTLSRDRCIALTSESPQRFRLWQIVKNQETLRDRVDQALNDSTPALAATLVTAAGQFLEMATHLTEVPCGLPLTLDTIAVTDAGPVYAGIVPPPGEKRSSKQWTEEELGEVFIQQFQTDKAALQNRSDPLLAEIARIVHESRVRERGEWPLLRRLMLMIHNRTQDSAPVN